MALDMLWAVLLVGFAWGFLRDVPQDTRRFLALGLVLGGIVAAFVVLLGPWLGIAEPLRIGDVRALSVAALSVAALTLTFPLGMWFGRRVGRLRSRFAG